MCVAMHDGADGSEAVGSGSAGIRLEGFDDDAPAPPAALFAFAISRSDIFGFADCAAPTGDGVAGLTSGVATGVAICVPTGVATGSGMPIAGEVATVGGLGGMREVTRSGSAELGEDAAPPNLAAMAAT